MFQNKLKQFMTTKPAFQILLEGVIKTEDKYKYNNESC